VGREATEEPVGTASAPSVETRAGASSDRLRATGDATPASLREPAVEEAAVGEALERYVDAYNRLDAAAADRVWPGVDERALARAFANLESQGLAFESCSLELNGAVATAVCRGQARYVPKVGDRAPISQSRTWRFRLRQTASGWEIVEAEAR
jgi:hypothetical protein